MILRVNHQITKNNARHFNDEYVWKEMQAIIRQRIANDLTLRAELNVDDEGTWNGSLAVAVFTLADLNELLILIQKLESTTSKPLTNSMKAILAKSKL